MFKITQSSKDEAIITLTDDIGIRREMVGFFDALTEKGMGIMNFFSTCPEAAQLVPIKPGRLKLINGEWKLVEPIQVTAK